MNDVDVWRSAKLLLDRHGDDAVVQATMKADKFLERGDLDGAAVWRRVIEAIKSLTDTSGLNDGRRLN